MRAPTLDKTVREYFPQPIAQAWVDYQTAREPTAREKALEVVFDVVARVLGAYLVAEAMLDGRSAAAREHLPQWKLSTGTRFHLVRELCRTQPEDAFLAEAQGSFFDHRGKPTELFQHVEGFVADRNRAAHADYSSKPTEGRDRQQAQDERLHGMLEGLTWLCDYRLVRLTDMGRSEGKRKLRAEPECWMGARDQPTRIDWVFSKTLPVQEDIVMLAHPVRGLLSVEPMLAVRPDPGGVPRLHTWVKVDSEGKTQIVAFSSGHGHVEHEPSLHDLLDAVPAVQEDLVDRRLPAGLEGELGRPPTLPTDPFLPPGHRETKTLGKGGMAEVVLARDSTRDEDCAIKFVRLDLREDGLLRERLHREASLLQELRHPHVVRGHYVPAQDGWPTLRMPAVLSGDLHSRLFRESPVELALGWMEQLLDAVSHLHEQGVVHRDLKPRNVLIDRDDRLVIIDFGLARSWRESSHLTQHSGGVGTAGFAAPEQFQGISHPPADIYSLGVVFLQILAGKQKRPDEPDVGRLLSTVKRHKNAQVAALAELCAAMVDDDASRRPDAREALDWLRNPASRQPPEADRAMDGDAPRRVQAPGSKEVAGSGPGKATGTPEPAAADRWRRLGPWLRAVVDRQVETEHALRRLDVFALVAELPVVDRTTAIEALETLMDWRVRVGWAHSLSGLSVGELFERTSLPWDERAALAAAGESVTSMDDLLALPARRVGLRALLQSLGRQRSGSVDEGALLWRIWRSDRVRAAFDPDPFPTEIDERLSSLVDPWPEPGGDWHRSWPRFLGAPTPPHGVSARARERAWLLLWRDLPRTYHRSAVRKRDGRVRMLHVPNPALADVQRVIGRALAHAAPPVSGDTQN